MKRDSNSENRGEVRRHSGGRNLRTGMPMDFQEVDQRVRSWFIVSFATTTEVVHLERVDRDSEQVPDILVHVPSPSAT